MTVSLLGVQWHQFVGLGGELRPVGGGDGWIGGVGFGQAAVKDGRDGAERDIVVGDGASASPLEARAIISFSQLEQAMRGGQPVNGTLVQEGLHGTVGAWAN